VFAASSVSCIAQNPYDHPPIIVKFAIFWWLAENENKEVVSMAQMHPYLQFNGNAREAFTFYHECFGGELNIQTVGESPMAQHMPPESHDSVMHATLITADFTIMGSDMMGPDAIFGNALSLALACTSKPEIEELFAKLSAGGTVGTSLREEFFGTYGDLVDKYSIKWMLQMDPQPKE
jgi:PhnB protein